MYLREAGLVVQYAEDAVWSGGDQLQTGVEVLDRHGIPLDLFGTVLLLQDAHTHTHSNIADYTQLECLKAFTQAALWPDLIFKFYHDSICQLFNGDGAWLLTIYSQLPFT